MAFPCGLGGFLCGGELLSLSAVRVSCRIDRMQTLSTVQGSLLTKTVSDVKLSATKGVCPRWGLKFCG